MFFQQLFDSDSSSFTYILADEETKEAIIIDPVASHLDDYINVLSGNNLTLVAALDTHIHADHITALGALREKTEATTYLGKPGDASCADSALLDEQRVHFGSYALQVIYTPGHTDNSYCFYLEQANNTHWLFTGDTLLIGGTGRTDFQNGNSGDLYDSLHQKILTLPQNTVIYPGHDYHGKTDTTLAKELLTNIRINIKDKATFIDFMSKLNLPNPKQMDIAVPANEQCGNIH